MNLSALTIKQSLNKAYRLVKPKRDEMEKFKRNLTGLLDQIDEKESEENVKIHLMDFLKNTWYSPDFLLAPKGKTDFVMHTGKDAKAPSGVLFEVKRPSNKPEMVTRTNLNAKAMQELLLYYLQERITGKNIDLRHLVITNIYEWFVFDAAEFERHFAKNTSLVKAFKEWESGQKVTTNREVFYKEIAGRFLQDLPEPLTFTYFDIRTYEKPLRNQNLPDDNHLIGLFKVLSPVHLLKLPFTNDSNSLDKGFYAELLHLIGLEEVKEGNKKLIRRKPAGRRQAGALLENAIINIESEDRLRKLPNPSAYGTTEEERLYTVALELCITWMNRVLFLKLLEAQLLKYHRQDPRLKFLNYATIPQYDELNKLFFQVLARRPEARSAAIQQKYGHVPYLNSSLFEITGLEDDIIRINTLDDEPKLDLYAGTVLRDAKNKPLTGQLNGLEYLLRFLDAYDFASEGREEIQEESKTLINAAVLGLIFEKINGYKDGSIYTPGFITMYMCRQAIRLAVVQKFKDAYGWPAQSFDDLRNYLADHKGTAKVLEFNALLNTLHLCDPAVGSGHFLVSALNELIACKAELGLLADDKGVRLSEYQVSIENDELLMTHRDTDDLFEYTVQPAAHGTGFKINPEVQRVQKTLFHEKQTLIENCLFGVDINPNSVKICRLRLWIELLKNAYYTPQAAESGAVGASPVCYAQEPGLREGFAPTSGGVQLQTLPNIDINIKQGNSLISRFALDADLSKALKSVKYNVEQYRNYVQAYKNTQDKEHKRELEQIIARIKTDFRAEITKTDPKQLKLNRLNGELINLTTQLGVFAPSPKEKKARQQQQQKLEQDIAKLSQEIEDIKSNAIYRNAFEWRFEFPEVLDNEGNFEGFDVVIGNPPYMVGSNAKNSKEYYLIEYKTAQYQLDLYVLFIEKSTKLVKSDGVLSLITPNSWLKNLMMTDCRLYVLNTLSLESIVPNLAYVFSEASVDTLIFTGIKNNNDQEIKILDIRDTEVVVKGRINQRRFLNNDNHIFDVEVDDNISSILNKIRSKAGLLQEDFDITRGVNPYDKYRGQSEEIIKTKAYHSNIKKDITFVPEIRGKHVHKFYYKWDGKHYISYGKWLAAPREEKYFTGDRIVFREILGKNFVCALVSEDLIIDRSLYIAKPKNSKYDIKYVLGVLGSKLLAWSFRFEKNEFDVLFPKIRLEEFKKLPIKYVDNQGEVSQLINQILALKAEDPQADTSVLEREIDQRVYQLYDLTPEEIALVEQG